MKSFATFVALGVLLSVQPCSARQTKGSPQNPGHGLHLVQNRQQLRRAVLQALRRSPDDVSDSEVQAAIDEAMDASTYSTETQPLQQVSEPEATSSSVAVVYTNTTQMPKWSTNKAPQVEASNASVGVPYTHNAQMPHKAHHRRHRRHHRGSVTMNHHSVHPEASRQSTASNVTAVPAASTAMHSMSPKLEQGTLNQSVASDVISAVAQNGSLRVNRTKPQTVGAEALPKLQEILSWDEAGGDANDVGTALGARSMQAELMRVQEAAGGDAGSASTTPQTLSMQAELRGAFEVSGPSVNLETDGLISAVAQRHEARRSRQETQSRRRKNRDQQSPEASNAKPPKKPWFNTAMKVIFILAPGSALAGLVFIFLLRHLDKSCASPRFQDGEVVERSPDCLDEDVYGAGVASLVRDSYNLVEGKGELITRVTRLLASVLLLVLVLWLQVFVLLQMQRLVAARSVALIRQTYDRYEFVMYGSNETHTYLTANGFHRGLDKAYFDMNNFKFLSSDDKDSACRIPFSQPQLLFPILFIWTLTVVGDMRRCGDLFVRLILATPTVDSMRDSTVEGEGEEHTVVGLTAGLKVLLMGFTMLPRWFIDTYLLWLGCRWLCSTMSFGDLLLNAVALEFVVMLKDLLYVAVMPDRNKRATQNTLIQPWEKVEPANMRVFLSAFLFLGVSYGWVLYYVYSFQAVLPDYKWDVHDTCVSYIAQQTSGVAR